MNSRRKMLSFGCAGIAGLALRPASAHDISDLGDLPFSPSTAGVPAVASAHLDPVLVDADDLRPLPDHRVLSLQHMHTGEFESFALSPGQIVSAAMARRFNRFMRDHHNGVVGNMDPELIHHLLDLQESLDLKHPTLQILSAYRSAATNNMLRKRSSGVAKFSMHLEGRAIDLNFPGIKPRDMYDAALDLKAGGVGMYRRSGFIHFDTGPVRHWS